jgi:endoplasmic reticulum-Golgi intermediate compartment protein 3
MLTDSLGKSSFGGFVSIVTILISICLFVFEYRQFMNVQVVSHMSLDSERSFFESKKVTIRLNVSFPDLPCELVTFDAADVMGNKDVDAKGHLFKQRIAIKDGNSVVGEKMEVAIDTLPFAFNWNQQNPQAANSEIAKSKIGTEGCIVDGFVHVNRAPGHLHFATAFLDGKRLTANHIINSLTFEHIPEDPSNPSSPSVDQNRSTSVGLNGHRSTEGGLLFEYFIKVVETSSTSLSADSNFRGFEYSVSENASTQGFMSSIYIRYDFSPVKIEYKEVKENLLSFLVRVFAIIGGIAGVMRLFGVVVSDTVQAVKLRKLQLGKLR